MTRNDLNTQRRQRFKNIYEYWKEAGKCKRAKSWGWPVSPFLQIIPSEDAHHLSFIFIHKVQFCIIYILEKIAHNNRKSTWRKTHKTRVSDRLYHLYLCDVSQTLANSLSPCFFTARVQLAFLLSIDILYNLKIAEKSPFARVNTKICQLINKVEFR